jgi:hypothetical protein
MDGVGRIESLEVIIADNDDDALAIARAMKKTVKSELWDRDRLVAKIAAHQP